MRSRTGVQRRDAGQNPPCSRAEAARKREGERLGCFHEAYPDEALLRRLLAAGVDPNAQTEGDPLPSLVWAVHTGKPEIVPNADGVRITEAALLAVKAARFPGQELRWDKGALAFTNHPEATDTIVRRDYRTGFAPPEVG